MSENKYKYIRGSRERGPEVIALLEGMGGRLVSQYNGTGVGNLYYIDPQGVIEICSANDIVYDMLLDFGEELFLEPDYKFNVGDKVQFMPRRDAKVFIIAERHNVKGLPHYRVVEEHGEDEYGDDMVHEYALYPYEEPQVRTWDDLVGKPIKGYYIGAGCIGKLDENHLLRSIDKDIAATEMVAKMMSAAAQISQLKPYYGGDPDCTEEHYQICYDCEEGEYQVNKLSVTRFPNLLRFHTREQAEKFLMYNGDLCNDYLNVW